MRIIETPSFAKKVKKLHKNEKEDLNKAIEVITKDPFVGNKKKGDIDEFWVYKFKMVKQLTLLTYLIQKNGNIALILITFGSHENFYRDLKKKRR